MIDPKNITNFNSSKHELQEVLLFWMAVAGKNAISTSNALERFLTQGRAESRRRLPFRVVDWYEESDLAKKLKNNGIGCYNLRARGFRQLVGSNFDLNKVSIDELESIPGIGMKTSRCFVMHSRRDARCAGLDVHILRYMGKKGHEVPDSTPTGRKYLELEKRFLELADREAPGVPIADFDLQIWRAESGRGKI